MIEPSHALLIGLFSGAISGLLGVSCGGVMVPVLTVIMGCKQQFAQMLSLAAQVLPTTLPSVYLYRKHGHAFPLRIIALISFFFMIGGLFGAELAKSLASNVLRSLFILYLFILAAIVLIKKTSTKLISTASEVKYKIEFKQFIRIIIVGVVAGISSGLLGIGGGLAITALSIGILGMPQHQAQTISLAVSVLPLTMPSVLIYIKNGELLSWDTLVYIIMGLVIGTYMGSLLANRIQPQKLRLGFISIILTLAFGMCWKTLI